jgi:hypothetical protein
MPAWSEITADNLVLVYDSSTGNVKDGSNNTGPSASVPIELTNFGASYTPPVVSSVALDGLTPTSLAITFDKAIDGTSGFGGFTLTGSAGLTFTARSVSVAVLTLTMSKMPGPSELAGLNLSYSSAGGNVKDTAGNPLESFITQAVTVTNSEYFQDPPAVTGIAIDAAAPTSLVLTLDQAAAVTNSTGFSISGSATATGFLTAVTGSGTAALTLTLNRKPSFDEIGSLKLNYDAATGNVKHNTISAIATASFTNATISTTGFTDANDSRPAVQSIVIDGSSLAEAKKVYITYSKAVKADTVAGFSISGSSTATLITGISGSGTTVLVLTLNNAASESEIAAVKLSYNMDLGNVKDNVNEDNLVLSFTNSAVTFNNYTGFGEVVDSEAPWLIGAVIEDATRSVVRVEFSEPVTIDAMTDIQVKVNDLPTYAYGSMSGNTQPLMDKSLSATRTISSVSAVSGQGGRIWDLTMSAAAQFGEILRFSTTASGAIKDAATAPNSLPAIPEFIINNKVKRTKGAFEGNPGFYVNGNLIGTVTNGDGDDLYTNAVAWLTTNWTSTTNIPNNAVITIVLGSDQTYDSLKDFAASTSTTRRTIIVTTDGGDYAITCTAKTSSIHNFRAYQTVVVDKGVTYTRPVGFTDNAFFMIGLLDGAKFILDGGIFSGNRVTKTDIRGCFSVGGGAAGAYFIMNGGEIADNQVTGSSGLVASSNRAGAAAIMTNTYCTIVINGGKIYNNSFKQTVATTGPAAGAICSQAYDNSTSGATSFFMTGGEIYGNTFETPTVSTSAASAGAVLISGAFQKVGGYIYGAEVGDASKRNVNNSNSGNAVKPDAVAVLTPISGNTYPGCSLAKVRDTTTGPADTLFLDSIKAAYNSLHATSVPTWAESYWDN